MVKLWIARAVNPLERLAKHIFRPVAEPRVEFTCLILSARASSRPAGWLRDTGSGPETGMEGRYHVPVSDLRAGGAPMMPPSMYFISGKEAEKRASMWRAVLGEVALRSR